MTEVRQQTDTTTAIRKALEHICARYQPDYTNGLEIREYPVTEAADPIICILERIPRRWLGFIPLPSKLRALVSVSLICAPEIPLWCSVFDKRLTESVREEITFVATQLGIPDVRLVTHF